VGLDLVKFLAAVERWWGLDTGGWSVLVDGAGPVVRLPAADAVLHTSRAEVGLWPRRSFVGWVSSRPCARPAPTLRVRTRLGAAVDGLRAAGAHVRHLGLVVVYFSVPNEFGLERWPIDYQESGRPAGLRPIQDATRAIAMFSFSAAEFTVPHRDVQAQKSLLRERMAGFGWLTPRILAHLDDTPNFYLDQVAQVVMDRWSNGRVGLIGDAAYSASPMSKRSAGCTYKPSTPPSPVPSRAQNPTWTPSWR